MESPARIQNGATFVMLLVMVRFYPFLLRYFFQVYFCYICKFLYYIANVIFLVFIECS